MRIGVIHLRVGQWRRSLRLISIPATAEPRRPTQADRLRQLLGVGRSLAAELDLDVLLQRVLQTAREVCGARYAALGRLADDHTALAQFLTAGEAQADSNSVLDVPIVVRGEAWGTLHLAGKEGAENFDEDDEEAIIVLAEWAAIAIDNARLFGISERRRVEVERASDALEAARDVALALSGETDLERVLELIIQRAKTLVAAGALLIWLVDADELRLAAHTGTASPAHDIRLPFHGSTSGEVVRSGVAVRVDDASSALMVDPAVFGLDATSSALIVPLMFHGRGLGVLTAFDHIGTTSAFSADDEQALESFAASAATAVATARGLEARRLRDAISAAEAERQRWARDLHDETLQGLGAMKLALSSALRGDPHVERAPVERTVAQLAREIAALRGIITDLRPPALDEFGLESALRTLADRVGATHGLRVDLDLRLGERRLDADDETVAYRVAQEALTNVVKHAHATRVGIRLRANAAGLELQIRDDGCGLGARPVRDGGYGITGMHERAGIRGGTVNVDARPDAGTTVTLCLPLSVETTNPAT